MGKYDVFVICCHSAGDGDLQPRGGQRHLFYKRGKNDELENRKRRHRIINGHHQSSGYGLFFFLLAFTNVTTYTRHVYSFVISFVLGGQIHPIWTLYCWLLYMRILLCGLNFSPRSGSALFSFSVVQQQRAQYTPSKIASARARYDILTSIIV